MNKIDKASDLYSQGYLCSQSVFAAFCEDYGIDKDAGLKISKFLGWGYLFRGDYCGAISGALMVYGLKYSSGEIYNELSDEIYYKLAKEHLERFKKLNGSCYCRDLLGADVSTCEGIEYIRKNGLFESKCPGFVKDSVLILTQITKEMEKRESKQYFEKVAGNWDSMQQSFFSEASRNKAYSMAKIKRGDKIADIGAGTGYITEGLIDKDVIIIAVDQSASMLKEMKKKFNACNCIDYRVGDSENLPLQDGEVDYAFANMYLHHVENPAKSICEMARIIKRGGKLIITDMDEHNFEFLRTEQFDKWLGFKREDVKAWFEEAGLKNVVIDCVGEKCSADSECDQRNRAEVSIFIGYGEK
jgi:C_GCAxxG_C_C family probable redox protein